MQVGKNVVIAAAIAFALLIGVVGFLLGHESRRPRPTPTVVPEEVPDVVATAPAPDPTGPAAARAAPSADVSTGRASPVVPASSPSPSYRSAVVAAPALPATAPPVEADPSIQVRDYFVQMASIQSAGPTGDPTEMANKLLASAASGDPSGFTALIKDVDSGIARAQQVHVPASCQDYHQRTLELLAESGRMLRTLQSSIARQDSDGLGALATSATSLQRRADALTAEARQIKARYGLAN